MSNPIPGGPVPVPTLASEVVGLLTEFAGLKPTHGGFLPRGLSFAAPSYFLPQPIGIADPAAFGLHHDFLLGVTYDRVALQFTDPEELERRIAAANARPSQPVAPKIIRSRADVALFDIPLVLASGQLEFLAPNPAGFPTPAELDAIALQQRAQAEQERLAEAQAAAPVNPAATTPDAPTVFVTGLTADQQSRLTNALGSLAIGLLQFLQRQNPPDP